MGQVLGFSHCKEFGSVSSTPDSTPPCTDGGNEESDFPELLTAREWSEDEEGPEDDFSSSSMWGTPRQNSFELTFSYIAFSEGESSGRRDSGRRRTGGRGRQGSLRRMDTVETFLPPDSPVVEWDPLAFMSGEEEEQIVENQLPESVESHSRTTESSAQGIEYAPNDELQGEIEEITLQETCYVTKSCEAKRLQSSEPYVGTESTTTSQPEGEAPQSSQNPIDQNTQEEPTREQWFSTLNLSEWPTIHIQIAVTDLIYWKDTERTGMVFTGLVVGLLSLFQLSIITVLSTLSLAIVCFTISVRIYCNLLHAFQLRDGAHPFQSYLEVDIGLSGEQAEHYMQRAIFLCFAALDTLKRLIFVACLFDSLKFLLLMYLVTYLGALCNGLTLLIIGVIAIFSVPLFYNRHQEKVDNWVAKVQAHVDNIKDILNRLAQGGGPAPDPTPGGAKPKSQ
ncbi:reticulon-2a isoform X1 [Tachysurus vachellii]|uniref:reticulon-2a isoform X1 n=1 Tax=Tachysurus vachellii TaxID=175792 RepID=UPI00296A964B|nr:reticulon-2a isoform X1 [Tachysurus vachellii]